MDLQVKVVEARLLRLHHQAEVLLRRKNTKVNKIKELSKNCNHSIVVNFEKEGKAVCMFCGKEIKENGKFVIEGDNILEKNMTAKEKLSFIRSEYSKLIQRKYADSYERMYLNLKEKLGMKKLP